MGKTKVNNQSSRSEMGRPALSIEARENQLIALCVDEAERRIRDGTASSQLLVHYLKQGTVRAQLEKEKLVQENKLTEAKIKAYESMDELKVLYEGALNAMKTYSGNGDPDDYQDVF
jgi:hypothetical protein